MAKRTTKASNVEDLYPLSPLQEGMLFHTLYEPGAGMYVEQLGFRLRARSGFDPSVFRRACERVVARHPVLRSAFTWKRRSRPIQVVLRQVELPFSEEDWSALPEASQAERLEDLVAADRARGFDPGQAPLLRVSLIRLGDGELHCLLTYHHILMDAWSLPLVVGELLAFYEILQAGRSDDLPLPAPYRDYIQWLAGQDTARAEAFWRRRLAGRTAPTPLGVDRLPAHAPLAAGGYARRSGRLPAAASEAVQAFARRYRLTPGNVAQGAWALLLARYGGEPDVVFGVTVSGRPESLPGVESMVGLFINTVPFLIEAPPGEPLVPWLLGLQKLQLELREFEHTPLVEAHGWSEVPRNLPLFETLFVFENAPERSGAGAAGDLAVVETAYTPQPNYPLSLMVIPGPRLTLRLFWQQERFDPATIARLESHFATLLSGMAESAHRRLEDLSLLGPAERHQIVAEWNDTAAPYGRELCLHELFARRAALQPDAVAVLQDNIVLTYGGLSRQADRLARKLAAAGVGPGTPVGVSLYRSPEMVVAVLGILAAGGYYVPLDVSLPRARLAWILRSLSIGHLIAQSRSQERLRDLAAEAPALAHTFLLDPPGIGEKTGEKTGLETEERPSRRATAEDTAYVIFTSGSTGVPKGVVVRHRPVVNLIEWMNRTFAVGPGDRILFVASLSFDLSVYDIFGLLAGGGSIRVVGDEDLKEPRELLRLLRDEPVTLWDSAPAALQQLAALFGAEAARAVSPSLRLVFLSGDWIPLSLPGQVTEEFPLARVMALGGATEATVWSNFFPVRVIGPGWVSIPYGRPLQNARYHVLDRNLLPLPIGIAGDLYIGGDCLATGYAEPAQTADRFVPDPFAAPGALLYRTGDRARYWPDGNLEFLGRLDQQVKIRGFRIEPGEIEVALGQFPGVRQTVVVPRAEERGELRLVAYLVAEPGERPEVPALRAFLAERLPAYMVPSGFVSLDRLPVTANGKLDRDALPSPQPDRPAQAAVLPRTTLELRLLELWEELFETRPIGVKDDFFELGGHSLLAVRLLALLQSRFDCDLPLRTLIESATIERLAELLAAPRQAAEWKPLVPLQPRGERPPLFYIHPGGGSPLSYVGLARCLGEDRPAYGLQASGLEEGQPTFASVEAMAGRYIEAVRTVQPRGPYQLVGWSFGGFVAYEMACQLADRGEETELLALLDTGVWRGGSRTDSEFLADLLAEGFPGFDAAEMERQGDLTAQLAFLVARAHELDLLPPGYGVPQALRLFQVNRASLEAAVVYSPRPYPGRLTLFRAVHGQPAVDGDPTLGWGALALGGVEVREVPGSHLTLLLPPHDRAVAAELRSCLEGQTGQSARSA